MLYNKHELLTRDDPKVKEPIEGINDGQTYFVYSFMVAKPKRRYEVIYDVEPREVTATVKDNICYVYRSYQGRRGSCFGAYGRQLYFADTLEEASKAYERLSTKLKDKYSIDE